MAHDYQEVGMILSNVDLSQVDLNVDEGRRVISSLIAKLQKPMINNRFTRVCSKLDTTSVASATFWAA